MNTYTCPLCGKKYTSASAMAQCVADCAKKEDKSRALMEAESEMLLAKEAFEQAIDEYNALSPDYKYTFTIGKKFTSGEKIDLVYKGKSADLNDTKKNDLESFLKEACNIKPATSKGGFSELDKEALELIKEMTDMGLKQVTTPGERDELWKTSQELKSEFLKLSESDKKEKIKILRAGLSTLKLIDRLGGFMNAED